MVRRSRIVLGVCLVGVVAGFFAAPLWSRMMEDQSTVDVRAQAGMLKVRSSLVW
jgi:hypothetical protein